MKHLHEFALSKYQSHLAIITHLFMLGAMDTIKYKESKESADKLWRADIEMIELLERRQRLLNADKVQAILA